MSKIVFKKGFKEFYQKLFHLNFSFSPIKNRGAYGNQFQFFNQNSRQALAFSWVALRAFT